MADQRLPFLRGSMDLMEPFRSPRGGETLSSLPSRDPTVHCQHLLTQLDALRGDIEKRPKGTRDPDATRELIAVNPTYGFELAQTSLGDKKSDVRVVGEDPATRMVLLDAANAQLLALREKIREFSDPKKKSRSGMARHAPLVAPLERIQLAGLQDLADEQILDIPADTPCWLELGCRGGVYDRAQAARSRREIERQLERIDERLRVVAEFHATTQTILYAKLSVEQLTTLIAAVDCVYETHLAERELRDWLLIDYDNVDLSKLRVTPPPANAPSVVLLDTGIAPEHPLLAPALLSATSVVPGIDSPVDVDGHGTEMAGIALHLDSIGDVVESNQATPTHWIQAVKVNTDESDSKDEAARATWAPMTVQAVEDAEAVSGPPNRVFAMAITARIDRLEPTNWSQAIEQLAWNEGKGRLLCISAGNADSSTTALLAGFPQLNLLQPIEDPSQAWNALTVGACTWRESMPSASGLQNYTPIAKAGEISPHTTAKPRDAEKIPNKPDVVFEGGNVAFDGVLPDSTVGTLTALTTGHRRERCLAAIWATSEATARASHLAAGIWSADPTLRPETVRGLIVHSAGWTGPMLEQFKSLDDRLRICGYGAPHPELALACARDRATVIVEDIMPNGIIKYRPKKKPPKRPSTPRDEAYFERQAKYFRLPVEDHILLAQPDLQVELRVTLSYFAEVHSFRRRAFRGLDLAWDMQGPAEKEDEFRWRINKKVREQAGATKTRRTKTFGWEIGPMRRTRGTVQSDRWSGAASLLAGHKLIAVMPRTGWWSEREEFKEKILPFSLLVTIQSPGLDLYTPLAVSLRNVVGVEVERS